MKVQIGKRKFCNRRLNGIRTSGNNGKIYGSLLNKNLTHRLKD